MNDKIKRMALEAGLIFDAETCNGNEPLPRHMQAINNFAALVAEQCAKEIQPSNYDYPSDWTEFARIRAEAADKIRRLYK